MDTILFDLDGTLLPMDQDIFIRTYFDALATRFAAEGYSVELSMNAVVSGTKAMVLNDGSKLNMDVFWDTFISICGQETADRIEPILDEFYSHDFAKVKPDFEVDPMAKQCIDLLTDKGYTLVLATNPLFPRVATAQRIEWAGLDVDRFSLVTTYETDRFCKPNPNYFSAIADRLGKQPSDCLMVGNDTIEDFCATQIGMDIFFITDSLINKNDLDLSDYKHGTFAQLYEYFGTLPICK